MEGLIFDKSKGSVSLSLTAYEEEEMQRNPNILERFSLRISESRKSLYFPKDWEDVRDILGGDFTVGTGSCITDIPFKSTEAIQKFVDTLLSPKDSPTFYMGENESETSGFEVEGFSFSARYSKIGFLVLFFSGPIHNYLYFSPRRTRYLHFCCKELKKFLEALQS